MIYGLNQNLDMKSILEVLNVLERPECCDLICFSNIN